LARIIATAADLMRVRGVGGTTLDDVVVASKVSKSRLYGHFEDKQALVRAVIEVVGERTVAEERERLSKVMTFAGQRRWRDALVENNALQEGRYGCSLGSLANEVADQDSIARQKLHDLFAAWQELFEELLRRCQKARLIPQESDVSQLATGSLGSRTGWLPLGADFPRRYINGVRDRHGLRASSHAQQQAGCIVSPLTDEHGRSSCP
jgi:AcrR family transcriptional regulator